MLLRHRDLISHLGTKDDLQPGLTHPERDEVAQRRVIAGGVLGIDRIDLVVARVARQILHAIVGRVAQTRQHADELSLLHADAPQPVLRPLFIPHRDAKRAVQAELQHGRVQLLAFQVLQRERVAGEEESCAVIHLTMLEQAIEMIRRQRGDDLLQFIQRIALRTVFAIRHRIERRAKEAIRPARLCPSLKRLRMTRRSDEDVCVLPRLRQRRRRSLPRLIHLALCDAQRRKSAHQHLPLALMKLPRPKCDRRIRQMLIKQPDRPRHPPAVADVLKLQRLADEDVWWLDGLQRDQWREQQGGEQCKDGFHVFVVATRSFISLPAAFPIHPAAP